MEPSFKNSKVIWHPKLIMKIYSNVLGEEVALVGNSVSDSEVFAKYGDIVAYREYECKLIARAKLSRESMNRLHEIKKTLETYYVADIDIIKKETSEEVPHNHRI